MAVLAALAGNVFDLALWAVREVTGVLVVGHFGILFGLDCSGGVLVIWLCLCSEWMIVFTRRRSGPFIYPGLNPGRRS